MNMKHSQRPTYNMYNKGKLEGKLKEHHSLREILQTI